MTPPRDERMWRNLQTIAVAFPLLLIAAIYGTWLLGWWWLGHPPRPSLDDPKFLGPIYIASGIVVALIPLGFFSGIASVIRQLVIGAWRLPIIIIGLWSGALALLRTDPIGVVNWWMD